VHAGGVRIATAALLDARLGRADFAQPVLGRMTIGYGTSSWPRSPAPSRHATVAPDGRRLRHHRVRAGPVRASSDGDLLPATVPVAVALALAALAARLRRRRVRAAAEPRYSSLC
jgi:hypothetical protein